MACATEYDVLRCLQNKSEQSARVKSRRWVTLDSTFVFDGRKGTGRPLSAFCPSIRRNKPQELRIRQCLGLDFIVDGIQEVGQAEDFASHRTKVYAVHSKVRVTYTNLHQRLNGPNFYALLNSGITSPPPFRASR
jgi:hypothetical protein